MKKHTYVITITFIAALGGFLFGFDTAVISGANPFIQKYFDLDSVSLGWAVSSVIVGCILGAFSAGFTSDLLGRKKVLIVTAVLFTFSAIGTALATSFTFFVFARILGGIGVGAASALSPTYIAEISPADRRGRLVSINQLTIVIGILVVYFTNLLFASSFGDESWRYMLGSEAIPSTLFFILLFFIPESPRWLYKNNQPEKAREVLRKLEGEGQVNEELKEIEETLHDQHEKVAFGDLFKGKMSKIMMIGIVLAMLQQLVGINAIIYYAPNIFASAGAGLESALAQTVAIGAVNLTFTFVAIYMVDRIGRRPLLLAGSVGMTVSLTFLVFSFLSDTAGGYGVLFSILGYIASFAATHAAVMWVVVSEIFPNKYRGSAMSVSLFLHWSSTYLVTQTFPWMLENKGGAFSFGIFAIISALSFIFVWFFVPETKGKSLEQIEKELV
ncbi:SP family arabinose:H+ symporter-like MFS transporter [Catalinimonas alkaloidigena]|uniref:sugar porter family MFS transporter n=1 Tax=Catalinimonas alkaloidigena TaxID=1075417 RepID=UPI00240655EC|nr:sugar porter family MFS transporter [Catalinimonas alkaloidigena]MDF9797226.1 SP family arabinose:H+ symporter-like MFS transporter [Catalinimonas alkaloidigena]